jgi:hypothetical protein
MVGTVSVTAAACGGGPPADIFVVQRDGAVPGARLTLRLTDDGGAYCNRLGRREITSEQLIMARELRRELNGEKDKKGLAAKHVRLTPGAGSIMRYSVLSEVGTVSFADTSPGQPKTFFELAKLTRDVAKGSCGLVR